MNKLIAALAMALVAVMSSVLSASPATAVTCTSQYIQPNKAVYYERDEEMGVAANVRIFMRVWSYACGSRDRFTDFQVGYTGYCNPSQVEAVIVNPSPIAERNVGPIRLPCKRTGGSSVVYSLYNETYGPGVGDRCAHVGGKFVVNNWFDREFATTSRCQG